MPSYHPLAGVAAQAVAARLVTVHWTSIPWPATTVDCADGAPAARSANGPLATPIGAALTAALA